MAGAEFRLGHTDHRVVEDFLSTSPDGVAGVIVDAKHVARQQNAIAAAHAIGVDVHVDPLTERLTVEGYSSRGLDYGHDVIDPQVDLATPAARDRLIDGVVKPQVDVATALTPPHFFVEDELTLDLNLDLVRRTARQFGPPVRPILAVQRAFLALPGAADLIARRFQNEGVEVLDLRLSPLGGQDDGPIKIRSSFRILQTMRETGLSVVLGCQGTIGETALALGLAQGYSVGIGYRESYDHKAALNRQRMAHGDDGQASDIRGALAGVYLPRAELTVRRSLGQALFQQPEIRTRMMCSIGPCAENIDGPARDPRGHYLHSRAHNAAEILLQPEPWRARLQQDRLVEAVELRRTLNKHLPEGTPRLKARTLKTLIAEIDDWQQAA